MKNTQKFSFDFRNNDNYIFMTAYLWLADRPLLVLVNPPLWEAAVLFHWACYPGSVVDGVVGAEIDPQNHAVPETSDVADGAVIVAHLSHQPRLL